MNGIGKTYIKKVIKTPYSSPFLFYHEECFQSLLLKKFPEDRLAEPPTRSIS
jgi:hypothetical protein